MASGQNTQQRIGSILFYAIAILLVYLLYLVLAPFLVALAWAAVLVVVSYPAFERMKRRWGAGRAALASTVGVTLILIVPTVLVAIMFIRQGVIAAQSIHLGFEAGHFAWVRHMWESIVNRFPQMSAVDLTAILRRYAEEAASYVGARAGAILRNTAEFLLDLAVTVLVMFYLYRDGEVILDRLRRLLPFDLAQRERLLSDMRDLIFASVVSSLVAAAAQGTLGGVAFAVTRVPAPVFWGVMMGLCSLVPIVGSALVWVPIAVSLMLGGHVIRGILVVALCGGIASSVDNVIRPWLISERTQMGGLMVFIGVLGGVTAFGILGIVLGPIILAATTAFFDLYSPEPRTGNTQSSTGEKKADAVLE